MPYVTSIERLAIERGRREGEAAAKAAETAEAAAREELKAAREAEAAANAARREALHKGHMLALELKFGKPGIAFAKQLKKIKDLDVLREVQRGIRSAKTVDELRPIVK